MGINKNFEDEFGNIGSYWRIYTLILDVENNITNFSLAIYPNKDIRDSGKRPMKVLSPHEKDYVKLFFLANENNPCSIEKIIESGKHPKELIYEYLATIDPSETISFTENELKEV